MQKIEVERHPMALQVDYEIYYIFQCKCLFSKMTISIFVFVQFDLAICDFYLKKIMEKKNYVGESFFDIIESF